MLLSGTYMGPSLKVPKEERVERATNELSHLEATFDLSYDVANWLNSATHLFQVQFVRDEHEILWTAGKCLDLRLFAFVIRQNYHL